MHLEGAKFSAYCFVTFWNNTCQGTTFERASCRDACCGENTPEAAMKPINEIDFERTNARAAKRQVDLFSLIKRYLATINPLFETSDDPTLLPARLRRDAGIDELKIERKR